MNKYKEIIGNGSELLIRLVIVAVVIPHIPTEFLENFITGTVLAMSSFLWVIKGIMPDFFKDEKVEK